MRKLVSLIVMMVFVLSIIGGCAQKENNVVEETGNTETKDKKLKIGVATYSFAEKWQTYMYDAMEKEGKEMNVELIFTDGRADSNTQLSNVEDLIARGVDAVIVCIVDTSAPSPYIKACKEAGIPLIGVNQYFEGADAYVGSESIQAGIMQMTEVGEMLGGNGNIGILQGSLEHEAARMRTEGNKQIIDQFEGLNIIREDTGLWDRAKGMDIAENWIQAVGDELDAIIANNDEMAIGAIQALQSAGMIDDVIVGGIDATIDALQFVKTGELDVTIFQSPFGQGAESVRVAVDLANGESVTKETWVPFEIVTKENVAEYEAYWE